MGIKGHVAIELKNVETGEIEKLEDDNMVTNALANIEKYAGVLSSPSTQSGRYSNEHGLFPVATKLFGGLYVFASPLQENANNFRFPLYSKLLAYCDDALHSESNRGQYNKDESGKTETGYRHVWDFSTSQANGQIGALSLTNLMGGQDLIPYNIQSNMNGLIVSGNTTALFNYIHYDEVTNEAYYISFESTGTNHLKIQVTKKYCPLSKFTLSAVQGTDSSTGEVVATWEDTIANSYINNLTGKDEWGWYAVLLNRCTYDEDNHVVTFWYSSTSFTQHDSVTLYVWTFDTQTHTLSFNQYTLPALQNQCYYLYDNSNCNMIWNGYFYANLYNTYSTSAQNFLGLYRISLANPSEWEQVIDNSYMDSSANAYMYNRLYPWYDGAYVFYVASSNRGFYLRYSDGTTIKIAEYSSYYPLYLWNTMKTLSRQPRTRYGTSDGIYWEIKKNYLGTIFNLSSPITKTAAQTMKIIYTLTDA